MRIKKCILPLSSAMFLIVSTTYSQSSDHRVLDLVQDNIKRNHYTCNEAPAGSVWKGPKDDELPGLGKKNLMFQALKGMADQLLSGQKSPPLGGIWSNKLVSKGNYEYEAKQIFCHWADELGADESKVIDRIECNRFPMLIAETGYHLLIYSLFNQQGKLLGTANVHVKLAKQ